MLAAAGGSVPTNAFERALGAPAYLDTAEYSSWFYSHPQWENSWAPGTYRPPDGVRVPSVGVTQESTPLGGTWREVLVNGERGYTAAKDPTPEMIAAAAASDAARGFDTSGYAEQLARRTTGLATIQPRTVVIATEAPAVAKTPQVLSWPTTLAEWQAFLYRWQLAPDTAVLALALGHYTAQLTGGRQLVITSGTRTQAEQEALKIAYAAGTPGVYKPADNSAHLTGQAFDAVYADGSLPDGAVRWIASQLGLRWGGDFKEADPVHFDTLSR